MATEKKATVRDIAKKAGVSVATVSYVLNDKQGTKISEATRKKVLQIANLLNYSIPERYKGQEEKKGYTIGIVYQLLEDMPSRNAEVMHMVHLLAERFKRIDFVCRLLPVDDEESVVRPVSGLDGIIAIDLNKATFKKMAGNYYIPILCLDMMINDFLFYQIHTDFEKLMEEAGKALGGEFLVAMDGYCNEGYQEYIEETVGKGRLLRFTDLDKKKIAGLKGKKIAAYGENLGIALLQYVPEEDLLIISESEARGYLRPSVKMLHNDMEKKANLSMNIMMNALEKKFDVKHEYKV
ncbi:MAG: LacI family DNA-binding transcriptional regulator [Lachnospiraceae bacterium]|nr:LacI family DNA-binding transcriptional regulator [Lachnospiraceae bacterium]